MEEVTTGVKNMLSRGEECQLSNDSSTEISGSSVCSGVQVHQFEAQISEQRICYQVTNLGRTLYIWIGSGDGRMNDLTLSAPTPYDLPKALPTATKIIGNPGENSSEALAAKLSKRLGKPVLLSLNVNLPSLFQPEMEKNLFDEIKLRPEYFS